MPTSTTQFTVGPRRTKDNQRNVRLYAVKRIRTKIEQAIKSFPQTKNVVITVTATKKAKTVDIAINMQVPPGTPDDKAPHPPRIVDWGLGN